MLKEKITNVSGLTYTPLNEKDYDRLCSFLISTIDDEPQKCKKVLVQYDLNFKSFYTIDKKHNHYCTLSIQLGDADNPVLSDPLFINDYATKEDLINENPL